MRETIAMGMFELLGTASCILCALNRRRTSLWTAILGVFDLCILAVILGYSHNAKALTALISIFAIMILVHYLIHRVSSRTVRKTSYEPNATDSHKMPYSADPSIETPCAGPFLTLVAMGLYLQETEGHVATVQMLAAFFVTILICAFLAHNERAKWAATVLLVLSLFLFTAGPLLLFPIIFVILVLRFSRRWMHPALTLCACGVGGALSVAQSMENLSPTMHYKLMGWTRAPVDPCGKGYDLHQTLKVLGKASPVGTGIIGKEAMMIPFHSETYATAKLISAFGWVGLALAMLCIVVISFVTLRRISHQQHEKMPISLVATIMLLACMSVNLLYVFHLLPFYPLPFPFMSGSPRSLMLTCAITLTMTMYASLHVGTCPPKHPCMQRLIATAVHMPLWHMRKETSHGPKQ